MYTSKNNWYSWQYGDNPKFGRQTGNLEFKTFYSKAKKPILNFKQELINAASSTLDHYHNLRPDIFFSSGVIVSNVKDKIIDELY